MVKVGVQVEKRQTRVDGSASKSASEATVDELHIHGLRV